MIPLSRTRNVRRLRGYTGSALTAKLEKLLGYYYQDGGKVDFKPKQRHAWKKAKTQLKLESSDKCAYCEADTAVVAHGDVEHFRPKSEYWWLAYCYDNFTFSCQICNQSYKNDLFPISGAKLAASKLPARLPTDPAELARVLAALCPDPGTTTHATVKALLSAEDAHLPDPYMSDPEQLFAWQADPDTEEVHIIAKGSSTRAKRALKAVEEVLGLNRTELLRLRWNHYDDLYTLVLALQEGNFADDKKKMLLQKLRRQAGKDRPFSAMKRFYLQSWGLL